MRLILDNERAGSYFEFSWANGIKSWFHGLRARRREPWTPSESIVGISTWTSLRERVPRLISAARYSLSADYTSTSPRAFVISSRRV